MERLGKIVNRNIYYFHWNDVKRNYYLENLPKQKWMLFVIGDDNFETEYTLLAQKSADENLYEMNSAGNECELIHDIFDNVIIQKKKDNNEPMDSPEDFENTALTGWYTNEFDRGYWMSVINYDDDDPEDIIRVLVCVDFTKRGVRKYLKQITKIIRKDWGPRSRFKEDEPFQTPIYDDEIKKPLRKSQKGFEKY
jgi:hypothetical protein